MLPFAALGVGPSNRSLVVVPARESYSFMLHPVVVEHSRSEHLIGAFVSYQTSLMQLLTVWHSRSAKSVGHFNSYVVPVPTVSGAHPRSLVDVDVRGLSLALGNLARQAQGVVLAVRRDKRAAGLVLVAGAHGPAGAHAVRGRRQRGHLVPALIAHRPRLAALVLAVPGRAPARGV